MQDTDLQKGAGRAIDAAWTRLRAPAATHAAPDSPRHDAVVAPMPADPAPDMRPETLPAPQPEPVVATAPLAEAAVTPRPAASA